tara:strand:- start:434 stop:1456 length:1023 start_codon:yes stop_codon:yes gene_type:complete
MKKAFITGITGQDGSYLTELLLDKGYEVHGIVRRSSLFNTDRIDHLENNSNLHTHWGDLTDSSNLHTLLSDICPDEIYNLGAQSHVAVSFQVPEYTGEVDAIGTIRLLNAVKDLKNNPKFYQASTSELYGGIPETAPQNEQTPFYPKSPYGAAKLYGYWVTINYRESYNLFASNGILFNHESPRRGGTFVTKKIAKAVADIEYDKLDCLTLGNLNALRDWGHAKDYVEAMWLMMQHNEPLDLVIASGSTYSVRKFVELAFKHIEIEIEWVGEGINEVGLDKKSRKTLIKVDPRYFRPAEVEHLHGDPSLAKELLGWKPKISFENLVTEMLDYEILENKKD